MSNTVVQYVLLRSDLLKELGWSVGALVAQACHASTAVLHLYKDDEHTKLYLEDLDNMHKVVLEVPNEESLKKVAEKLKENAIAHKLWVEQPENIPTCLAIKPYPKDEVKKSGVVTTGAAFCKTQLVDRLNRHNIHFNFI